MGLKYNPTTGKLLRTDTPRLVSECPPGGPTCEGIECCDLTQVRVDLTGVAADAFSNCSAGQCNAFNTTYFLPPTGGAHIAFQGGCTTVTPHGDIIVDDPDFVCGYTLPFSACDASEVPNPTTYTWDATVFWKDGVGWVLYLGIKSPGTYNLGGGFSANFCYIFIAEVADATANYDEIDWVFNSNTPEECGSCNTITPDCNWNNIIAHASVIFP